MPNGFSGLPNKLEPCDGPVGGGPAGVVELPNRLMAGLLVGVVVFVCSLDVFPILANGLPVLFAAVEPPNKLGA